MKKILGLDLGTNSIGWALIEIDHKNKIVKILGLGSRILSMNASEINTFENGGKLPSAASKKTTDKTVRKLNERFILRRDRLHCVLNLLNTLPQHYKVMIDFETEKGFRNGQFKKNVDGQLAYLKDDNGKSQFLFMDSFKEMKEEFKKSKPDLFYKKKNGKETLIPFDWTLYYLRKKALTKEISKEELAWITLSFNQKRGYTKTIGEDEKAQKEGEISEVFIGKVKSVSEIEEKDDMKLFEIILVNENNQVIYTYKEECAYQITVVDDLKEVEMVSKLDENGDEKSRIYTIKEIQKIDVIDVKFTDKKIKENFIFEIVLKTGWIKEQQNKYLPKWKDTTRDFIIKTNYDKNGNLLKQLGKDRKIDSPKEEDWGLLKLKTETALSTFNTKNKTVGIASYIYNELLENPLQKIKGDLITVIERKYYKEELDKIYQCQKQFHDELKDETLYQKAIHLLYPNNENHRNKIKNIGFPNLITDDIILYQRDLKSKKSLITNCSYEKKNFTKINLKTGKEYQEPLKAIHKANPLFQEFRILQFINNLKIIELISKSDRNDEIVINKDITSSIFTETIKEKLFESLNNCESITQKQLFTIYNRIKSKDADKISVETHKWNYVIYTDDLKKNEHKELCNETRYHFILRLKRIKNFDWETFLTPENEYRIWHFFYSVKNQAEFKTGINTLFEKLLDENKISIVYKEELVKNFINFGGFKNDYGSYSEKALKKLLPFFRIGKYSNQEFKEKYKYRIDTIIERLRSINDKSEIKNIVDDEISKGTLTSFYGFKTINEFENLSVSQACYLVYNRYSEVGDLQYWKTPYDIENYLKNEFKQHSLNNPVVEKVLVETLQLVKDVWKEFGENDGLDEAGKIIYKSLFDSIHIELGREMKKNAKEKEKETKRNNENKKTNERIVELLKELKKENNKIIEKSPFQQEKLRIIENDLLSSIEFDKNDKKYFYKDENGIDTNKILFVNKDLKEKVLSKDLNKISKSDFERYKLWLDQRYQSPYTGRMIKLSDLFDREKYEIEHIFPQERITLNAMYNKVICETEVNKAKKATTGYQFIIDCNGTRSIKCAAHENKEVTILSPIEYETLVKSCFTDKKKQEILLSKEIPDQFTNSQLNNARYISKIAMKLLSNIVREDGEDNFCSKNVLPITGIVTSKLKQDWQLNDTWNELIQPRFERLNKITNSNLFGAKRKIDGHDVFINQVPEELSKNFDKKRIDHRHHAMDALVIALATEGHVNYLNNISSQDSKDDKLQQRIKLKNILTDTKKNNDGDKSRYFLPPAQHKSESEIVKFSYQYNETNKTILKDIALEALKNIVGSCYQKGRIIRQRTNKYQKPNENGKIEIVEQKDLKEKVNFNVRQDLHKATYYGKVKLNQHKKQVSLNVAILQIENISDFKLKELLQDLKVTHKLSNLEIESRLIKEYPTVEVYEEYVASRFENYLESFSQITPEKIISYIESITDISIQNILKNHLKKYNLINDDGKIIHQPEFAFSLDGIKELNQNIKELNNGKEHKSIFKVRIKDALGSKFSVSEIGQKNTKYVVTSPGSNAFCGVYENNKKDRKFIIPTLRETIENLKQGNSPCSNNVYDSESLEKFDLKFILLPSDLVFVPTEDELINPTLVNINELSENQINRIYKFTDGSGTTLNFVPYYIANLLYNIPKKEAEKLKEIYNLTYDKIIQNEIGLGSPQSKNQNSFDNVQIKSICWKIEIDRLGKIINIIK